MTDQDPGDRRQGKPSFWRLLLLVMLFGAAAGVGVALLDGGIVLQFVLFGIAGAAGAIVAQRWR